MLKFADISYAGIGLIYNSTLREIEITNNFMISTWNKTDTSECRHPTEDEIDQCQIIKWLEEMNLREQTNRIYSVQLDGLNDNTTTNMSGMRLVQVSLSWIKIVHPLENVAFRQYFHHKPTAI